MNSLRKTYAIIWPIIFFILLALFLTNCSSPPPVIEGPRVVDPPTPVVLGAEVSIRVDVSSEEPITYVWETDEDDGEIISGETSSAIIWRAPQEPGLYNVRVKVRAGEVTAERSVAIAVQAATATHTSTPTFTPTPTHTPTYTVTPTETLTPTPTSPLLTASSPDCVAQPSLLPPLSALETVLPAFRTDQPPKIDGCLNDEIWAQAQPLTYAVHTTKDATTVMVRLLWDDQYLYAGFDIDDTQVESSSDDNLWDGDSVSVVIDKGGDAQEYRRSLPADGNASSEIYFKEGIIFNDPDNRDEGYSVEMQIRWDTLSIIPAEGSTIAADFLSVDHDEMPGVRIEAPGDKWSKISWDGDQSVDTARKSIFLSDPCFKAKIISPSGTDDKNIAAGFPVTNMITISWEPSECVMIVQSYQNNELKTDYRPVTSGTDINIGDPGSGEMEIKIWSEGSPEPSDSIWVWVDASTQNIIELNPADFERQGAQFIFFTNFERTPPGLPVQDGIDLSDYDLEFTFRGADGRQAYLFYKSGQNYANVVSFGFTINSDQPLRFNPFVDDREESDQGFDFAHIWAIGARITGGIGDVELTSARLIKR